MGAEGGSTALQSDWKGPFTPRENEVGALEDARRKHSSYLKALSEWESFQEEHAEKVQLWNTIKNLIFKSRHTEDFSTKELYDALGVSAYFEDELNVDWQGDESVETALHISAAKQFVLELGNRVTWRENERTGNEFIDFGRELVSRRVRVEVRAQDLILRMKYGPAEPTGDERLSWWKVGIDQWQQPDLTEDNEFYMEFLRRPLDQQLVVFEELTTKLAHCQRGRVFLAHLFEFKDMAIFNPYRIARPGPAWELDESGERMYLWGDDAIEKAIERKVSIVPKQRSELTKFYTDDLRVKVEQNPDIQSDSIEEHLTQVLLQALPGLNYYYAVRSSDEDYLNDPDMPDPKQRVSNFVSIVTAAYYTGSEIRDTVEAIDWSETRFSDDPPGWSPTQLEEKLRGEGTWTLEDTKSMAMVMLAGTDSLVAEYSKVTGRWTAPLKVLTASIGGIAGVSTFFDPTTTDDKEQVKAVTDIAGAIASLDVVERYLPDEFVEELPEKTLKRKVAQRAKLVGRVLKRVGPLLDVIGVILSTIDVVKEIESGDYDSAAGYGLMGLGGLTSLAAGFLVSGPLLVVGIALGLVGAFVVAWFDDSALADWLKTTRFGNQWNDLDTESFLDPEASTYGYRRIVPGSDGPLGEVDFGRQHSQLYSLIRPIGVSEIELGMGTRLSGGEERYVGRFEISPSDEYSDEEDIGILEDGYLFVRPLPVYQNQKISLTLGGPRVTDRTFEVSETTSGEYLHRFSLADAPGTTVLLSRTNGGPVDDRWRSMLGAYQPDPFLNRLGRWLDTDFGAEGLALDVHDAQTIRTDGGDAVTNWSARVWDMSLGTSQSRIFGWQPGDIGGSPGHFPNELPGTEWTQQIRYVEVIYVPPEVASSFVRRGTVSIRPEELPIVSRERRKVALGEGIQRGNQ